MPRIGILDSASWGSRGKEEKDAFFRGLAEAGFKKADIQIVDGSADNDYHVLLPKHARDLLDQKVEVIVAPGGPASAQAAQVATLRQAEGERTPVVFTTVADPVRSGLVASLKSPGGNLTGTFGHTSDLEPSRLKILQELVKQEGSFGILINGARPYPTHQSTALEAVVRKNLGRNSVVLELDPAKPAVDNIQTALNAFKEGKIVALLVTADPYFNSKRKEVIALANKLAVPAIYQWPSFVQAGGLMSYGPSKEEGYRNAGEMAGQILNGQHPRDLPVRETTAFELVVTKDEARWHGMRFPKRILDRPVRLL